MAKVTYGPSVSEARGKAGDTVFTRTRGGNIVKALKLGAAPPAALDHAMVYKNAPYTVQAYSYPKVPFDAILYDNNGLADLITQPTRLTAKRAGIYLLSATFGFNAPFMGPIELYFQINNADYYGDQTTYGAGTQPPTIELTTTAHLAIGDYLEATLYNQTAVDGDLAIINYENSMSLTQLHQD